MIKPGEIPQFTGDLAQLEKDYGDLKKDAGNIRDTGVDVHSQFQGLSAYYQAPEAEKLFATTKPVKDRADGFADDLEKVSSALSEYATEVRPLVDKLKQLKTDAAAFVDSVKDDDEWEYDEDKVGEHNQLRDDITATVAAFWAAERTCHNKITALWGGTQMVAGDGSDRKDQYGFSAEDMKNAKLPWGDPVEEKHHWYEVGHWVKSFVWDGLIVDGVWGTIKGLGTLVGFGGWEAMGQAWKGLAQLATGLVLTSIPGVGAMFWTLPDDKLPSWIRDSRTAMKETGKALVAWDQWGKNPARAAGAVTFNVLTTVFTGGAGGAVAGAGKAGAVAKVLGTAGKVIDPMTYIAKGAGAGLSKIGDISAALKGVGNIDIPALPEGAIALPEGAVKLPDGTVNLPEGAALPEGATRLPDGNVKLPDNATVLPPGTVKLPTEDGVPAQYLDPDGNILDEGGNVVQKGADGPGDIVDQPDMTPPASGADNPRVDSPVREPALVGAGAATVDNAGQVIRLGSDGLDDIGRVGDDLNTPGTRVEGPGGTADNLPGGTAGNNLPGGTAGNNLPGGTAGNLPTNSIDTPAPVGAADNATPGTTTGDHLPGGRADDLGGGPSGSHDLPGGGTTDVPPRFDGPPGGGLDDLGRTGDDAAETGDNAAGGPDATTPARDAEAARPEFMRDGDNPYGPEGSLTPEQIHEIQVYRANHEPGYFEDFYKSNGNRKNLDFVDESGRTPPQLTRESPQHPWTSVRDAPEPLPPNYLGDAVKGGRETASPEALARLDEAAANRHHAVNYDQAAGRHKAEAVEAHKTSPTPESELTQLERTNEYKAAHRDMRDNAEAYGEAIAEHHVIPEHYPNATREPLDGPLNGNDQFDQVWRREDGGFVVVEAKSSTTTDLGARNLPNGKRVSQGTREYFLDILDEMRKRGEDNPNELLLADELEAALARGDVDYIVVKGQKNAGEYAGYSMRNFDIADRSTP
ncbi:hypothetical protein [Streptomyces sp. DH24]|uniref:hypothetical protein n=1 Tax=Streptomyces sp. DH24 TaxID=3040123 RepID=UPI002441B365|nr:hypothetical protein [Streptomyces sp. DH24]MDG9716423.1 hypothetical protein [Streptomyces sp. DH24]